MGGHELLSRSNGGLTEFIPTPAEKRDGVLRDHALDLMRNLHTRLRRLEDGLGMDTSMAGAFDGILARIGNEEDEARRVHEESLTRP